jgi:UDP-glucose 4-epimerase
MKAPFGKVVVTGGAGFIGSHLAARLVALGAEVHVVDDLSFGDRANLPAGVQFHEFDIRLDERLAPVVDGADVVFHLAALSNVAMSFDQPLRVHSVNVVGTLTVLDVARRSGIRRVVYSSSSAIYGDQPSSPISEELQPAPQSPYGLSKYEGELLASLFCRSYGLQTVSLRYFNVYGPRQNPRGPYAAAIARFHEARRQGRPLQVVGDGEQTRDFVMVDDVVQANIAAALRPEVGNGEALNVGTGQAVRVLDLARLIGGPIEFVAPRPEIRHSCADIARARRLLGFAPSFGLAEGLRRSGFLEPVAASASA